MIVMLLWVVALGFLKQQAIKDFGNDRLQSLIPQHSAFQDLFQTSFYFYYKEQFVPEVRRRIKDLDSIERVVYLSTDGKVLFDSDHPELTGRQERFSDESVALLAKAHEPQILTAGFKVSLLIPSGQFTILYQTEATRVRRSLILWFMMGLVAVLLAHVVLLLRSKLVPSVVFLQKVRGWFGLRTRFLLAILVVNLFTGAVVFVTLSELQTKEISDRITRESVLFSQFTTHKVISDFSNYFYFYLQDRFLPAINAIVATNENLLAIRVITQKDRQVLFDSENLPNSPVPVVDAKGPRFRLAEDQEDILRVRGLVSRSIDRGGQKILSIVHAFVNDNQESLFLVEYLYGFSTLEKSLGLIRRQILLDLIPSLFFGILVAWLFAQWLIRPIRRLVSALGRVTKGDYEVSVQEKRSDELGSLITAFNAMTIELRKKTELKKYLSDATYRHIMEGPEARKGEQLRGMRVRATILFSDIRDFVGHCEGLDAEEVTSMLNEYFTEMVTVIQRHSGEVDKFIGDAILAVFYPDPEREEADTDCALRAIYCSLEMKERLKGFNEKRALLDKRPLAIGIGVNFGEVISGPIGARDRMDFTVIGDVVNVASRMEKLSKRGRHTHIVFSDPIEERVRGLLEYELLTDEKIRGKKEDVSVFELIRIKDLNQLIEDLESADEELQMRSLELLGHSLNDAAIQPVIRLLSSSQVRIRIQAVEALRLLAKKNDPVLLDALFERLRIEKVSRVTSKIISTLGAICQNERLLELEPSLKSQDERIVANAIEAMGQLDSSAVSDLLLPYLASTHNRVKANAAMALFYAGRVGVLDTLKPMLMHSDHLMRSSAAFAIGELTVVARREQFLIGMERKGMSIQSFLSEIQQCVPMLVGLLRDKEVGVRRQAILALGKIKDRSAVLPLIDSLSYDETAKQLVQDVAASVRSIGAHQMVRDFLEKMT